MNLTIVIEELVVEGIALHPSERALLARTVQRELTHLYQRSGAAPDAAAGQQRLAAPRPITYSSPVSATDLGRQVARAVHGALQR